MTQVFSKQQQARIDERLRIEKLPKSSRSIHDVVEGDLITDGYRFFIVTELQSYNGYEKGLMVLFALHYDENTDKGGSLEYSTTKRYSIMERK